LAVDIPLTEFQSVSGVPLIPADYSEIDLEMYVADRAAGQFALDSISVVPEPSTFLLLLAGLAAFMVRELADDAAAGLTSTNICTPSSMTWYVNVTRPRSES